MVVSLWGFEACTADSKARFRRREQEIDRPGRDPPAEICLTVKKSERREVTSAPLSDDCNCKHRPPPLPKSHGSLRRPSSPRSYDGYGAARARWLVQTRQAGFGPKNISRVPPKPTRCAGDGSRLAGAVFPEAGASNSGSNRMPSYALASLRRKGWPALFRLPS